MSRKQKIIQQVDELLAKLAVEFNVPKPNYCIHKLNILKKLDDWSPYEWMSLQLKQPQPAFQFNACFMPDCISGERKGKLCYITALSKNNRHASKKAIVHEFFHYKHYVESGYDWSKQTKEERDLEEKRTQSETRRYMRNLKERESLNTGI